MPIRDGIAPHVGRALPCLRRCLLHFLHPLGGERRILWGLDDLQGIAIMRC